MARRVLVSAVLLALALGAAGARAESEEGFVSMFNGKDLAGWEGEPGYWSVESGAITGTTTPQKPLDHATYLFWRGGKPADFELRATYRFEGKWGNSGVNFRSQELPKWDVKGYQADMETGPGYSGILYECNQRAIMTQRGQKVLINGSGKRAVTTIADAAELQKQIKANDWNECVIVARGPEIILKINGAVTSHVIDREIGKAAAAGLITLQLHPGPPMKVQFKDLRIKHLKAAAGDQAAPAASAQGSKSVLIVTGEDIHAWRETTPVVKAQLEKDSRWKVTVTEDLTFVRSPELRKYDVVVLHFKNSGPANLGPEAQQNLERFAREGGGLVVVHFACGAFQEWPEFVKLAGRVWNPKMRAHDPHGPFRVDIVDQQHPITKGMKAFDTVDELYTCLDGNTPVSVLATAVSKVDQKTYPMAFVLECGKGRTFHTALGHDVKALSTPEVGELLRRGTAWTARLEPVAGSQP